MERAVGSVRLTGSIADPEFRRERARRAALARTTARAHVRAIVDRAAELTPEDLAELRAVLAGGPRA